MTECVDIRNFEFFVANGTNFMFATLFGTSRLEDRYPFACGMTGLDIFYFEFFSATNAKFMLTTVLGASRRYSHFPVARSVS